MSTWMLPPEFAPQAAVMIAWPHQDTDWANMLSAAQHNFAEIIAAVSTKARPWVLIPSEDEKARIIELVSRVLEQRQWKSAFSVDFSVCTYNDTWTRDYGPLVTVQETQAPLHLKKGRCLDFIFNGWGGKFPSHLDNQVNRQLWLAGEFQRVYVNHTNLELSFESMDFVLEGGSLECNSAVILTTSQCLLNPNRNGEISRHTVEQQLREAFDVKKILWLHHGHLEGDDTDSHIDTLARFIDPRTIVYQSCDDPSDAHYTALKKMRLELEAIAEEHQFILRPLPWPSAIYDEGRRLPATYANFLILNGTIILPTYGCDADQQAIKTLESTGFEILPIDCQTLIRNNGSLHCSTMQLPLIKDSS